MGLKISKFYFTSVFVRLLFKDALHRIGNASIWLYTVYLIAGLAFQM